MNEISDVDCGRCYKRQSCFEQELAIVVTWQGAGNGKYLAAGTGVTMSGHQQTSCASVRVSRRSD